MEAVIKKFYVNDITTQYGAKKKYDIYIDTEQGEWKFSAWGGQWNQDWNQGVTINIPDMGDQRWKTNEFKGQLQYTLAAPPKDGFAKPASTAPAQAPSNVTMAPPMAAPVATTAPAAIPVIQVGQDIAQPSLDDGQLTEILLQVEEILRVVNELKLQKSPLLDPAVQESMGATSGDIDFPSKI